MTMMGQAMPEGKRKLHEQLDVLCQAVERFAESRREAE